MADWHIPVDLVRRFLQTEATRDEGRKVVRHLVGGCPECSERLYQISSEIGLWSPGQVDWEQAYEKVFERALAFASELELRLAVEKLRGWAQWASLEPLSPQQRLLMVESDPRLHNFGLYDRLLEASRSYLRTEPKEAVDIISLSIEVAERLDSVTLGKQRIVDLLAAAWAALGNARRLAANFEGARQAFNESWRTLELGTGDPLETANVLSLEASYVRDIGEFETAESVLEEALELYRKAGDVHQQGRTLLKMGDAIGHVSPERGISHIKKALALLDPAKEPRLELCAQHDLAWYLNDAGHSKEALAVLDSARPLYRQFPDRWTQLRLHWLEGRIAYRMGDLSEAESIFQQLWEELRARDLHHELVLVSIDLAEVLVQKGEVKRAADLVIQFYPIMAAWGLHRYALAAWLMLQEAIARQEIGDLFQRLRQFYRRHWVTPAAFE